MSSGLTPKEFASRLLMTPRDHSAFVSNLFCSTLIQSDNQRSVGLHVLRADGNRRPKVADLVKGLCTMTLDYCIPRKQVQRAHHEYERSKSSIRVVALQQEARRLFTDLRSSGEGGELLLFLLTEAVLKYPQAVSKMALKTSSRMHVHGLDGIYISCSGTPPTLRLHYGESKVQDSPTGSIRATVASIAGMLRDEGFLGPSRRDFFLLNSQVDLGDPALEMALQGFLDPHDSRYMNPVVCGIMLAGHQRATYPVVLPDGTVPDDLIESSRSLLSTLEEELTRHSIQEFKLDLFLVPFPNVQDFRDSLLKELGLI